MDSQIHKKLYNYAELPDKKNWSLIEDALDDQTSATSKKLFNYQQQPGIHNWQHINQALNQNEKAIVVPFYKKYKYITGVGAVAILVLLLFAVNLIINKSTETSPLTQQSAVPFQQQNKNPVAQQQAPVQIQQKDTHSIIKLKEEKPARDLKNNDIQTAVIKYKAQKLHTDAELHFNTAALIYDVNTDVVNENLLDKYIVVTADDGKAIKLPKKIYDNLSCSRDLIDYEKACKEALASLQKKIATQISSTDFTGLIDILQNLQENQ